MQELFELAAKESVSPDTVHIAPINSKARTNTNLLICDIVHTRKD